jgi:hypothetical protein
MAKWLEFLDRDGVTTGGVRLLSEPSLKLMYRASAPGSAYGLGWIDGSKEQPPRVYHAGVTPTFTAFLSVALDGGTSVAILSNGSRTFVRGSGASYIQYAITAIEQGNQPKSSGVSSREVDIPLLILTALMPFAAFIQLRRRWRVSPNGASSWALPLIWTGLLLMILSVPSVVFEMAGGRDSAWSIGLHTSSWLWLFYSSPMSVVFCAVVAICSVVMVASTFFRMLTLRRK